MAFAREFIKFSKICNLNDFTKLADSCSLKQFPFIISVRGKKHWDPKFKWLRGKKMIKTTLPFTEEYEEERRYMFKSLEIYPRYWKSRPLTITSVGEVIDPYKPKDGDGKVTNLEKTGVLEKVKTVSKDTIAERSALRKIKNYDENFSKPIFLQEAHDIYVQAHTVLMKKDFEELSKYATEKAVSDMMEGLEFKTIKWKFIESLEPPQLVQSRVQEVFVEKNLFAQLTVRFHTKQSLAVYDRFGRLMLGSEILAKDVLEYVVFEKHINNEYGVWKVHAKIIPEWKEPSVTYNRTYMIEKEAEEEEEEDDDVEEFLKSGTSLVQEAEDKKKGHLVQSETVV